MDDEGRLFEMIFISGVNYTLQVAEVWKRLAKVKGGSKERKNMKKNVSLFLHPFKLCEIKIMFLSLTLC